MAGKKNKLKKTEGLRRQPSGMELKDAIRMAAENPKFAKVLVKTPQEYQEMFNLSEEHILALEKVKVEDFANVMGTSITPESFAETVILTEKFLRERPELVGGTNLAAY